MDERDKLKLGKYLHSKKAIIFDNSSSNRLTIRKLLKGLGIDNHNILVAESFRQLTTLLEGSESKSKYHIIVTYMSYSIADWKEVFEIRKRKMPNFNDFTFFCTVENDYFQNELRLLDVDGYAIRPLSFNHLEDKLSKVFLKKIGVGVHSTGLYEALAFDHQGNTEQALEKLMKVNKETGAWQASYFLSKIYLRQKKLDLALKHVNEAIQNAKTKHFKLVNLKLTILAKKDELDKAKEIAIEMVENNEYVFSNLTNLIRVLVYNKCNPEIFLITLNIIESTEKFALDHADVKKILALNFAFIGNYLMPINSSIADKALTKAIVFAVDDYDIIKKVIEIYIKNSFYDKAERLLNDLVKKGLDSTPFEIFGLDLDFRFHGPEKAFTTADKLYRKGKRDKKIYEILIKSSCIMRRKKDLIEDLIFEAGKIYPDDLLFFQELATGKTDISGEGEGGTP